MDPRISLPSGAGFYCWVDPDTQSLLNLGSIRERTHPLVTHTKSTGLHVSVIYSYQQPERLVLPAPRIYRAVLTGYEVWPSEDRMVIVGLLDSPDLEALNAHFACLGAVHTFDPYVPHITVGHFMYDSPEIYEYTWLLNQTERPKRLVFGPELRIDTLWR